MAFPRQEYWSGLSVPPPGNFPDPGIEPESPALQEESPALWLSHKTSLSDGITIVVEFAQHPLFGQSHSIFWL